MMLTRKTRGAAGADLSIPAPIWLWPFQTKLVFTDYVMPQLHVWVHMDVRPRSSISKRGILIHLGLLDSDYVGNRVGVIMSNLTPFPKRVSGRVAQLVVMANETHRVFNAENKERAGGFGSTGTESGPTDIPLQDEAVWTTTTNLESGTKN